MEFSRGAQPTVQRLNSLATSSERKALKWTLIKLPQSPAGRAQPTSQPYAHSWALHNISENLSRISPGRNTAHEPHQKGHSFPLDDCQEAFERIKNALRQAPSLPSRIFCKTFEVTCDASVEGIFAVLTQDGRPLAFESRKLSPPERNYTTGEQDLLAVVHALKLWRCYLEGPHFTVITDHSPLVHLNSQSNLS